MREEEHWAVKAVEDAAMKRALDYICTKEYIEANLRVLGLSIRQCVALAAFYEKTTGRASADILKDN